MLNTWRISFWRKIGLATNTASLEKYFRDKILKMFKERKESMEGVANKTQDSRWYVNRNEKNSSRNDINKKNNFIGEIKKKKNWKSSGTE